MSQSTKFDLEFALADAGHSLTIDFAAIKEQFPIMDVASALTGQDVKKVGSNTYRLDDASCPLCGHNDCFTLYPDDNRFKCFSCDENGDVLDLVVKCDKARSSVDAARLLLLGELSVAPTVRKVVKLEQPVYTAPPARLQELFNLAARHYQTRLDVEELMELRGHSEEVLVGLDIGFSGGLNKALKDAGFSQEERLASGLVKLRNDAPDLLRDFFPSGVYMFPHFDRNGQVSRFTFKDPNKQYQFQLPSQHWLNGVQFYGEECLNAPGPVALVEGENDRLSLMDAGWPGPVLATIGTLSQTQLAWLGHELADRDIVTFFDTDEAGDKYRSKVVQLGLKLTQVKLPESVKDIDEYLHGDNPLPLTELVAAFTLVESVAEAEAEAEAVQDDDQQPEVVKVMPRTAIFENELNDSANAERFVQMHGHNLKFVPELGGFIYFDGTHWTQNDLTPMTLAQIVGKEIQYIGQALIKQACKKEELSWAYAVLRHGSSSLNRAGIQNMLELAKPMMTARLHELNANPMLLGTANGVIDLKSGRLLAPRRAFMMTHHSPVAYDPAATCPRWEQFIGEITCGDAEYAAFLQRCVGYWITGRTDEQLLFFLHGGGCNGKSTFMSVIQQLLGEFSRQISSNVLLFNRNGNTGPNPSLTKLVDARLVVANELPEGSRMDENLVKAMTGDDVIVARAPYAKKEMEFRPSFSLVMVGNHKPEIRDTSNGMWRRMLMLPFNASFTKAQLDPMLMEKLQAEMPGILNWAIQGCQMWQEQRLKASIPARLKQDVETYRAESDMVGCFLEECTQARAGAKEPMSEVYAAYSRWAQQNGEWAMKQLALKKKLMEKGFAVHRYNSKATVIGLTLLDSEMADMTASSSKTELGANYTV
ncbi:phage/plasmid primase, P4 family [Aeromonas rivipollensis]|uniref:phage/plasmid primase, P4 family n=1 Tax=Aeromonas rivipollensis TaxID=948519 RepID=UPI00259F6397|nr:phage/plasmid primase, P4 family [Aeromonas rivipollensis]MDM5122836.1 phage/plasmid primase, P4 family [Aeromonas rivipollensis]